MLGTEACANGSQCCVEGFSAAANIEALFMIDLLTAGVWLPVRICCVTFVTMWMLAVTLFMINVFTVALPTILFNRSKTKPVKVLRTSVWTIHGKQYDLTSFAKNHPGGTWALELGRNRDCTGLFESYHIFADQHRLTNTLKRFEIKVAIGESQAQTAMAPSESDADNHTGLFFNDPFHVDVKHMLRTHFEGKSHKLKPEFALLYVFVACLDTLSLCMYFQGSDFAIVAFPVIHWVLAVNLAHDGSHFAVSRKPWINRLCSYLSFPTCYPTSTWFIQHVVQHHVYTNDTDDVDLYHFLPVCRTTRITGWATQFALQMLSIFLVIPTTAGHLFFVVPLDLLTGQLDAITGTKRYNQCQNLEDFIARRRTLIWCELVLAMVFPAASVATWGFFEGFQRCFLVFSVGSWLFIIATQGAHLQEECMIGKEDKSWAKRQSLSSLNFKPESVLWRVLTGGLNTQSLHHVAPGVGSSHFTDLWPKYKAICEKHGVELQEVGSIFEFFLGFLRWVRELASHDEPATSASPPHPTNTNCK